MGNSITKTELSKDPEFILLGLFPSRVPLIYRGQQIFTAVKIIIIRKWERKRYLIFKEWINKSWQIV